MEELLNVASVPAVAACVYWSVNVIKYAFRKNETLLNFAPLLSLALGVVYGLICFFAVPEIIPTNNFVVAVVLGGASGLTATGFNQIHKQLEKLNNGEQQK